MYYKIFNIPKWVNDKNKIEILHYELRVIFSQNFFSLNSLIEIFKYSIQKCLKFKGLSNFEQYHLDSSY